MWGWLHAVLKAILEVALDAVRTMPQKRVEEAKRDPARAQRFRDRIDRLLRERAQRGPGPGGAGGDGAGPNR